jgi:hypothetical protein
MWGGRWRKRGWLFTPDEMWTRIRYVENNPIKEGLAAQHWDYVSADDNWPIHEQNRKS